MRISDWSSDVCSSDLPGLADRRKAKANLRKLLRQGLQQPEGGAEHVVAHGLGEAAVVDHLGNGVAAGRWIVDRQLDVDAQALAAGALLLADADAAGQREVRSEEHTSELQSLMRNSYDVFCLKKKTQQL